MQPVSEGLVFALSAGGVLSLMLMIALVRSGVDGMLRLWPAIGPVLCSLLSASTAYWFSARSADERVQRAQETAGGQFAMVATAVAEVTDELDALRAENARLRAAQR